MWNSERCWLPNASSRACRASAASGHEACAASPTTVHDDAAAAAAEHPPLHRREVLGLVDEHVGVLRRGRPMPAAQQPLARRRAGPPRSRAPVPLRRVVPLADLGDAVREPRRRAPRSRRTPRSSRGASRAAPSAGREVVDQRDVGHRPGAGLAARSASTRRARRPRRGTARPRRSGSTRSGSASQSSTSRGVELAPPPRHERLDVAVVAEPLEELGRSPSRWRAPTPPRRGPAAAASVAWLRWCERSTWLRTRSSAPASSRIARPATNARNSVGASGTTVAGGAGQHPADPQRALDRRDRGRVEPLRS